MIIDYTVSISTILSTIGFLTGGIIAFGNVIGKLREISIDVAKLESVPISIATLELKIVFLEQRISNLEAEKKRTHVAA